MENIYNKEMIKKNRCDHLQGMTMRERDKMEKIIIESE